MKIKVNGKIMEINASSLSLTELLKQADVENPDMVSVQLNGEFAGKDQFAVINIKDGDEVDFLYFMGGGNLRNY